MSKTLITLVVGAVAALTLAGCASSQTPGSSPSPASEVVGTWGEEAPSKPWLRFGADGRYVGADGCNGLQGTYVAEGDGVALTRGISTLKACVGVDTWLKNAVSVSVGGDSLIVYDAEGVEIGTLSRAAS